MYQGLIPGGSHLSLGWVIFNSCILVDLCGVTALLHVILLTGAGT